MKSKTYRNGKTVCKAYMKDCGNGWEVGFTYGTKCLFVSNFIHSWEANQWYTTMNQEIRSFTSRYPVGTQCPKTWFCHFMTSHLYKKYYSFVNHTLVSHSRRYAKAVNQDVKKYNRMSRNWNRSERSKFLKAA